MRFDLRTPFGNRVARRLDAEQIIWLTTVGAGGTPQPSPVWFLWNDGAVLIYSEPNMPKLANIARNPRVSLTFNCTPEGADVVIMTGTAQIRTMLHLPMPCQPISTNTPKESPRSA